MASLVLLDGGAATPKSPRVLFVALVDYLGMERVPAAMGALGADCAVLSPPGFCGLSSRHVKQWYRLPAHRGLWLGLAFLRRRLEEAVAGWQPDLVIPLDDIAAQYLRVLAKSARLPASLRDLLERSFGDPAGYAAVCSRLATMQAARAAGIHTPHFFASRNPVEIVAHAVGWGFPVVLKGENSCGGDGVAIARDARELRSALARYHGGPAWKQSRRAAVRVFWNAAGLSETAGAPALLQSLVPGVPAMHTVAAWRGEILDGVSFVTEQVHPAPTGPSTIVRQIENAEMAEAVRRFVFSQKCSGLLSFDFMLDETTGEAALIEINARPIGTTHLGRHFGHDPFAALLARLGHLPLHQVPSMAPETRSVALFPKELIRAPEKPERLSFQGVLHDVPYDDPPMFAMHLARLRRLHPAAFPHIEQSLRAERTEAKLMETIGFAELRPRADCRVTGRPVMG
ncbi:MAG TPA: hypothetical protein VL752_00705 [Acidisoma sp.]|uniref:hypothetical protein n=1 Tax=Acidisoma sp. TaxID=1872115 RepID=UPI002BFC35C2|nr:hypothetical protein [Acidisoma sp.]HTH99435.1 hypothetical protein [Acidisoma sp.]